jgi:hypothetical protein
LGLQIPIFNNLNEIKNRTPLLPYIIRPLAYETSFAEFIELEELVPARAYVQSYGFLPFGDLKIDYAAYIGNSPNINSLTEHRQTGIDTTFSALFGLRLGIRYNELKVGFSTTWDQSNFLVGAEEFIQTKVHNFEGIHRNRYGVDLSYNLGNFSFEGEFISVIYDDDIEEMNFNKKFIYGTVGYRLIEKVFIYGSYWFTDENYTLVEPKLNGSATEYEISHGDIDIVVPNMGIAYNFNDRITFKSQLAKARIIGDNPDILTDQNQKYFAIAVSVIF